MNMSIQMLLVYKHLNGIPSCKGVSMKLEVVLTFNLTSQRIGVDSMVHLLADTSIFVSLPNDCYCQMTGKIILYLAPLSGIPTAEKSATSKRPLESTSGLHEQQAKRVKLSSNNQTVTERFVVIAFIT